MDNEPGMTVENNQADTGVEQEAIEISPEELAKQEQLRKIEERLAKRKQRQ